MKEFIRKKLKESLTVPYFRLVKDIKITPEEMASLKAINWRDIGINDLGGEGNIAYLGVDVGSEAINKGIVVDIQVLRNMIYQVHIHLAKELHAIGLGYKIYKAIINDLGHLYSGKGRRMNPYVTNIWNKLKNDADFDCISNNNGDLCMVKNNPQKKELINFMG